MSWINEGPFVEVMALKEVQTFKNKQYETLGHTEYREWLKEYVGLHGVDWIWAPAYIGRAFKGYRFTFNLDGHAILFKLKFSDKILCLPQ